MRAIEDNKGNAHSAKLRLSNLEQIKIATGLEIVEVDDPSQPLPRLFSSPLKMWKVVDILIGHRLRTDDEPKPDYLELFDIDKVAQWLEDLITDFHPTKNKSSLSKRFAEMRENLNTIMDEIHRDDGEILIEEGQPGDEFFVVAEGAVKVVKRGRTVAVLAAGDHFGEMSLFDSRPRSATVVATAPSTLIVVHRSDFDRYLMRSPTIMRTLLTTLAERLR